MMAENFGRSIKIAQTQNKIKGIKVTKNVAYTTYQHFIDDTILAGASTKREIDYIKLILNNYTKASGQKINAQKYETFFLKYNIR